MHYHTAIDKLGVHGPKIICAIGYISTIHVPTHYASILSRHAELYHVMTNIT